jgi:uncharacterized membrane protein YeiH
VTPERLLFVVDLAGTLVFGLEGGLAAIAGRLDVFGVMVLAFATALGGGLVRDVLIGAIPPAAIRDPRYATAAFVGGGIAIVLHRLVTRLPRAVSVGLDAAGLALFAVSGAVKAHDAGIAPLLAVLMGTITGVGGGTVRDLFLARVPAVLRVDVYAVAALAGAMVTIVAIGWGRSRPSAMATGAGVCFLLRVVSAWQNWNLPRVGPG